ncbi:murein L,D-transpeptidase [Marinobacter sp.]|uniref:murein L,D-transpeptidase n=1 Tax=Marinobacter sp. TaxID=50741 RepID=UPI0035C729AF
MPALKIRTSARAVVLAVVITPWLVSLASADTVLADRIAALSTGQPVTVLGARLMATRALTDLYASNGHEPVWGSQSLRQQLLQAIESATRDGLDPRDYHAEALAQVAYRNSEEFSPGLQADVDLLLSDAFLMLGSHLLEGKVNPRTIHAEWRANRRQRDMAQVLQAALASGDIAASIERLRPGHSDYHRLAEARQSMAQLMGQPWLPIPPGTIIRPGDQDQRLAEIRRRLEILGDLRPTAGLSGGPAPERYGPDLETALARFQARHGLEPDGLIGPATLAAINLLPVERVRQIDDSLERWRWLPESLGDRFVLVNIAGYELKLIDRGAELLNQRVIVGRPYRQTPVFSDQIRYLVLNPTWTVPRKLMVEDQLPEIIRNPDYLQRLNMKVYQGWGAERRRVDPDTVDWATLSRNHFPYQLVQSPGPNNALGQIKFMFPNQYDVYLHDTPARDLFSRVDRSFSSGCIRVEQPFALAEQLLAGDPRWNRERLLGMVGATEPSTIVLPQPVPVYIQYWTAWVNDQGRLQFRNDIYNRDSRLLAQLRQSHTGDAQRLTPASVSLLEQKAPGQKE